MVGRAEQIREGIDRLNAREFDADADLYSEDVKFHAPGLGQDLEGRDAMVQTVRGFIEGADVRYEVDEIIEHGPFVVAFTRSTGTLAGERKAWDLCQVMRYDGDKVVEFWALRGGEPQPAGTS